MYNAFLKKILKQDNFHNLINSKFCKSSFSQFGEDLIINKLLHNIPYGNFLDIGSFHPMHFSNTFLLYLKGWRGINIDGNKEMVEIANKVRPLDKNIFAFLSAKKNEYFYISSKKNPAMNRVVKKFNKLHDDEKSERIITTTVNDLMQDCQNYLEKLYYLNIDLEYLDYEVLKTLDFNKYHPLLITIEIHNFEFNCDNEICKYLKINNYSLHSYTKPTAFFLDNNFKDNNFKLS